MINMTANTDYLLFAGSYAPEDKPGIYAYTFNSAIGNLTSQGSYTGIANPSFLTIHPNGKWLYAVSETSLDNDGIYGSVHSFSIQHEQLNIKLQLVNRQSTDGDWPCHVEIDASGRWLIASNYGTGNAALFPILSNGALGEMEAFVQHEGHGPNKTRQEGPHAHSATFTPDNRFIIIADLGIDQLIIYKFDADTGSLTQHAEVQSLPGAGPRHLAFHPSGKHVLVANELDSSVTVYDYDAENGTLHALQTINTLPPDAPESIVADIHFSSSGQHVYVSNRGHDSLAIFDFDEKTGVLIPVTNQGTYGKIPRNFAIDPSGTFLLTANQDSNNIVIFLINQTDGHLTLVKQKIDIPKPVCLKIMRLD
jgi:6-phosphogluconolactonase